MSIAEDLLPEFDQEMATTRKVLARVPYIEQTRDAHEQAENVLIRMRPERWLTVDFAKAFGAL